MITGPSQSKMELSRSLCCNDHEYNISKTKRINPVATTITTRRQPLSGPNIPFIS